MSFNNDGRAIGIAVSPPVRLVLGPARVADQEIVADQHRLAE
jgi:hypothetical protein